MAWTSFEDAGKRQQREKWEKEARIISIKSIERSASFTVTATYGLESK